MLGVTSSESEPSFLFSCSLDFELFCKPSLSFKNEGFSLSPWIGHSGKKLCRELPASCSSQLFGLKAEGSGHSRARSYAEDFCLLCLYLMTKSSSQRSYGYSSTSGFTSSSLEFYSMLLELQFFLLLIIWTCIFICDQFLLIPNQNMHMGNLCS